MSFKTFCCKRFLDFVFNVFDDVAVVVNYFLTVLLTCLYMLLLMSLKIWFLLQMFLKIWSRMCVQTSYDVQCEIDKLSSFSYN